MTVQDGLAHGQKYANGPAEPGRLDINGQEWYACDPYPTWFRWEKVEGGQDILHTNPARFVDQEDPKKSMIHVMPVEDCYGQDIHYGRCDGIVRLKWSGVGCSCGNLWYCA